MKSVDVCEIDQLLSVSVLQTLERNLLWIPEAAAVTEYLDMSRDHQQHLDPTVTPETVSVCFFLPFSPVMFLTGHPALIERGTSVLGGRWRGTPASFKRRAQSNILRERGVREQNMCCSSC